MARVLCLLVSTLLAAPSAVEAQEVQLVGFVTEQGQKRCLKDWKQEWHDLHHQVGFTRLTGTPATKAFEGKVVVVTGTVDGAFKWPQIAPHEAPCPMAQMRSDWVESKGGFRIQRGDTSIKNFKHTAIEELKGLTVTLEPQPTGTVRLNVNFKNHLRALEDVTLTVHYEGCYGKPGATSQSKVFGALGLNETISQSRPAVFSRDGNPRGKNYRAASIQLSGKAKGLHFDFDVPLRVFGAGVSCPRR